MTTTAHERASKIAYEKHSYRIATKWLEIFTRDYLQALLDDAETAEKMAFAIAAYFAPSDDPVDAAKSAIATLKRMGEIK